jgi:hypothetical protein
MFYDSGKDSKDEKFRGKTTNVNANIVYETHLIIFLKRLPALLHKYRMKTMYVESLYRLP